MWQVPLSKIVSMQTNVDAMLKDSQPSRYVTRRTHRTYPPQFKAELVAACQQPGASIAALAMQHGMNANVLHRWLKEHRQGMHTLGGAPSLVQPPTPAFIPVDLGVSQSLVSSIREPSPAPPEIRIELQHHAMTVTLHWPMDAGAECAQMLRALLR